MGHILAEDRPLPHQCVFDFIQEPVRRRPRKPEYVFFGLLAGGAGRSIAECREQFMADQDVCGRRIGAERLHVSLSGLGGFGRIPSRIPYGARLAAGRIALPSFEVVLHRAVTLQGGRPDRYPTVLLAKGEPLLELGDSLRRELNLQGLKAGALTLPHMTLFYGPQRIRPVDIEPIRIWIDCFHLIHSERGLSRYNILGSWSLDGAERPLAFGSMAA
jgi:2'-5' RNA ligase